MRKAFTLIELLVVIAIIAILSIVVVLTLNPQQKLQESRDANRLSDMATLQSAISLYVTDAAMSGTPQLGSSTLTYLSLVDPTAMTAAGSNCSALGFPAGPFHCSGPSFYRNTDGTGWLPLNLKSASLGSSLGNLPVDPTNNASSGLYYSYSTDGQTWKVGAIPESNKYASQIASFTAGSNPNLLGGFPNQGWVQIPGNSTFNTQTFSVMKYDAVCSDQQGNYLNDYDTGYRTYSNSSKSCKPTNNRQIASLPGGWPIANIAQTVGTHDDAVSYCASIGAHLLTNNEWQTIVWNAENVPSNWGLNAVGGTGAGAMFSGHNDTLPYPSSSPASSDDTQGYFGTDGPVSGGGTGTNATQRRTLTLSNGQVLWDMAGNVSQWTSDTIVGNNEPHGSLLDWNWIDFTSVTSYGTLSQQAIGPVNSSWNHTNGIGELYSVNTTTLPGPYAFFRGGHWSYGGNAGVEALILVYSPVNIFNYIGFRCAR